MYVCMYVGMYVYIYSAFVSVLFVPSGADLDAQM